MILFDNIKKLITRESKVIRTSDLVVCIDDRPVNSDSFAPPLKYGQVYTVINIATCLRCGRRVIDVGLIPAIPRFTKCGCDGKKQKAEFPGANIHWAGEFRFRKIKNTEIKKIKELNGIRTLELM